MKAQKSVVIAFLIALIAVTGMGVYLLVKNNEQSAMIDKTSQIMQKSATLGASDRNDALNIAVEKVERTESTTTLTLELKNSTDSSLPFVAGVEIFLRDIQGATYVCVNTDARGDEPVKAGEVSTVIINCPATSKTVLDAVYYQPNNSPDTLKITLPN
jgi:hypothetical protein